MNYSFISPDEFIQGTSTKYRNWQSLLSNDKTCQDCYEKHGSIFTYITLPYKPIHAYCRCLIVPMRTKIVGTVTEKGWDGADAWLMYRGKLPNYYITIEEAIKAGWISNKGNLSNVCPGKMIGDKPFLNKERKLPIKVGRSWYEADFDFTEGYRNNKRILYSNDGLIFVSFDHAQTFYELIK